MEAKQQKLFELPPLETYQYLLIIKPHDRICRKVMELKGDFAMKFNTDKPTKSQPHISLKEFEIQEKDQDRLVSEIKQFASQSHPVKMKLTGIDGFPHHTLYIKIEKEGLALKHFLNNVKNFFQHKFNPHVTIARQLDKEVYLKAVEHYSKVAFSDSFTVNSLVLLKRKNEKEFYKTLHEFKFEGKAMDFEKA
jgi:2'-5' RNA ligase